MKKRFLPVFLAILILAPLGWTANPPPFSPPALPDAIRSTLNQEYPGWKLAPVTPQVLQEFKKHHINQSPSLVSADFDHDGKRDYALQIALTSPGQEEQIILVFLARGEGYEETILQSMGLDPTSYLWLSNKVMTETGANAQDKLTNKNVLRVMGGPIGDTTYAYDD